MRYVVAVSAAMLAACLHAHPGHSGVVGTMATSTVVVIACDEDAELQRYEDGELSETRESDLLGHTVKVTRFCAPDADMDAAFDWLDRAETRFVGLFGHAVSSADGVGRTLHIVVGEGNALCRDYGFGGCGDIDWGRAYQTCRTSEEVAEPAEDCTEAGVTFMDVDPDESGWFRNIVHEYGHLLDYLYIWRDSHYRTWSGGLTEWWREGMPEYLQMSLRESMGLEHNPSRVSYYRGRPSTGPAGIASRRSLVSTVAGQRGMDPYISGRALVRYLAETDPIMLEDAARLLRRGVWRNRDGVARWWALSNDMLEKHEMDYAEWNTRNGAAHPGFGDGPDEIEGETMLDQFLGHVSVRTGSLADWIDAVCGDSTPCRIEQENHGFTLNGVEGTDETLCYVDETIRAVDYRPKTEWLNRVKNDWFDEKWVEECAPEDPAQFWIGDL